MKNEDLEIEGAVQWEKGYVDDMPQETLTCDIQYFPRLQGTDCSQSVVKSRVSSFLL